MLHSYNSNKIGSTIKFHPYCMKMFILRKLSYLCKGWFLVLLAIIILLYIIFFMNLFDLDNITSNQTLTNSKKYNCIWDPNNDYVIYNINTKLQVNYEV